MARLNSKKRPVFIPKNDNYDDGGKYDKPNLGAWAAVRFRRQVYYSFSHSILFDFLGRTFGDKTIDNGYYRTGYYHTKRSKTAAYKGIGGFEYNDE